MAEMTAEQALSTLVSLHIVGPYDLSGVIEVIEQQAQEIEQMNQTWPNSCEFKDDDGCCLFPGAMTPECHADACSVINGLKQEIAKKDRMIESMRDCRNCKFINGNFLKCESCDPKTLSQWKHQTEWLEKEAEGGTK